MWHKSKKNPRITPGIFSLISGFDIHSIRSACIIKTEISHFSYMSVISEGYMIMESLAIENFIAQLNSCGIAVRTIFSDCVANYRELQENIFCTLVCYATVNTLQICYSVFINAAHNNTFFSYFCHVYHLYDQFIATNHCYFLI